jgi:hypothetical protein|tara:strand:+ start:92 stop:358 length:267 start_codon:yes stop_codon:yes gene_type:complete
MIFGVLGHYAMHIITVILAGVLFVLSLITYMRNKKKKFLLICSAFLVFGVKEIIIAVNTITFGAEPVSIFTHILNLVILTLFASGILR